MPPAFDIVDDTIVQHGGSYDAMSARESHVFNSNIMTVAAPIIGSLVVWISSSRSRLKDTEKRGEEGILAVWNFNSLVILWFWSVSIFGLLVYSQRGHTDRLTFMIAILHTQVEVLISALLLRLSVMSALILAGTWGFVLFLSTLVLPNMALVFFSVSIIGGANDAFLALILFYGRKWLYALGAFFHFASAAWVFAETIIFIDVVLYNALIFVFIWFFVAFTTAAIIRTAFANFKDEHNGYARLNQSPVEWSAQTDSPESNEHEKHVEQTISNPMQDVNTPPCVLLTLVGVSLALSSIITVTLYVLAE